MYIDIIIISILGVEIARDFTCFLLPRLRILAMVKRNPTIIQRVQIFQMIIVGLNPTQKMQHLQQFCFCMEMQGI